LTPFFGEDPKEIFARLEATGRAAIYRMSRFFRRRCNVTNIADYAAAEAPFASELANYIESKTQQVGDHLTLEQDAFCDLANELRRFANLIREAQPSTAEHEARG
jgi:hypothetical protein